MPATTEAIEFIALFAIEEDAYKPLPYCGNAAAEYADVKSVTGPIGSRYEEQKNSEKIFLKKNTKIRTIVDKRIQSTIK